MDIHTYIEDYFDNRLSAEERKVFEERLHSDAAFAKEVKEHALLINAFDELQSEELSLRFKGIEQELGSSHKKTGSILPMYLKWAASIVLIAALSVLVYLNSGNPQEELFVAYYKPYPNVESPVSRSDGAIRDVWMHYENGNYAEASKLFRRIISQDDSDHASWFYLGICELEMDRVIEAENAFKRVIDNKESKYTEQAKWYLALTYLKAKDDKVLSLLEEIQQSNSGYEIQAKELLEKL